MLKKLLTLVLAIFILTTLPVVSFAEHSETVLNDTFIITQMKFMADNDYVLDNVTNEVVKVRLEVTNLYTQEENTANIIVTAKDKTSKKILIANSANQTFEVGDTTKTVDIPFDLTDPKLNVNNINVSFYIWSNGNIKPLSRDLIINSATDLKPNSILYRSYGIYKLEGIVEANSKFSLLDGEPTQKGYVTVKIYDDFDCPDTSLAIRDNSDYRIHTFSVGTTNAEDLIGYPAIFYVKLVSSGKYEIVAVKPLSDAISTLEISASDLDDDALDFDASKPYFRYYKENAGLSTKVSLDSEYMAVWNNSTATYSNISSALDSSIEAEMKLIDWNNDAYYDVLFVTEPAHLIAESINVEDGIIETYQGVRVDLDIINEDANVTIKDVYGNPMQLSEIENGDVLAIIVARDGTFKPSINLVKTANYDSLEITVLKDSFVEGKVTEFAPTYDALGYGYLTALSIAINGVKYDVAVNDAGIYNESKIDLQAEGTFYLNKNGKIIGFESLYVAPNYGLIMSAYTSTNKSVAPLLTILSKDGIQTDYNVASSVRLVNPHTGKYTIVNVKDRLTSDALDFIADTTWEGLFDESEYFRDLLGDTFGAELDEIASANQADEVKARFITYKLNANNEVVEITPAVEGTPDEDDVKLGFDATDGNVAYNATGQKLGRYLLSDDAVVFDVDFYNPASSKVHDIRYFVDDGEYEALVYSKDEDGYYKAVVILENSLPFVKSDIAVVKSIAPYNEDAISVCAYSNNEEINLIFDYNEFREVYSNLWPEEFEPGTVIMYNADYTGLVYKYTAVGKTTITESTKTFSFDSDFAENFYADSNDGDAFYLGWIYNKTSDNKNVFVQVTDAVSDVDYENREELFTVVNSNQYTLKGTPSNFTITPETYTDGNVKKAYYDANNNAIGYYVLVRTYENEVTDIIAFDDNGQIIDTNIELNNGDIEVERNTNYGLIMSAYTSSNKSVLPQLTILSKDGTQADYNVATSVNLVNPHTGKYTTVAVNDTLTADDLAYFDDTAWEDLFDDSDTFSNLLGSGSTGVFSYEFDEINSSNRADEIKARFITYKLNESNEIVEITPASTLSASELEVELGFVGEIRASYNKETQKLGNYLISDDVVVYDVDFINPINTGVYDVNYFINKADYEVLLYSKDNEGYYNAVVILSSDATFEEGDGVAIVKSKSYIIDANNNTLTKIVAYKNGEEVELIFDDNQFTEVYSNVHPEDFSLGTVFMYNANTKGYVTKYSVVGTTSIGSTKDFTFDARFASRFIANFQDGEAFYLGWIAEKTRNNANLTVMVTDAVSDKTIDSSGEMFTVVNSNQYTITGTIRNPSITLGTYTDGNVDAYDYDSDLAWFVLIRTFEEEVVDIISFDDYGRPAPVEPLVTTSYEAYIPEGDYIDLNDVEDAILTVERIVTTDGIPAYETLDDYEYTAFYTQVDDLVIISIEIDGEEVATITVQLISVGGA